MLSSFLFCLSVSFISAHLPFLLRNKMSPWLFREQLLLCALDPTPWSPWLSENNFSCVPIPCHIPHYFVSSLSHFSNMPCAFQVSRPVLLLLTRLGAHLFLTPTSTVGWKPLITSSSPNLGVFFLAPVSMSLIFPKLPFQPTALSALCSPSCSNCVFFLHGPVSFFLLPMFPLGMFSPQSDLELQSLHWFYGEQKKLYATFK